MELPDFGDIAGLTRLYWQAVRRIRDDDLPEAEKAAILEILTAHYRAATAQARHNRGHCK